VTPRTLIVIPTYNERVGLREIVEAVRRTVPGATLLIVDDASPDGTGALANELSRADPQVLVKHRIGKEGLGRAYLDAFRWALDEGWEHIVQMDADFSHDPADVPRLLAVLADGADLAIGSRYVPGGATVNWGLGRRLVSRGGGAYARLVLGVSLRDLTSGFKAWRAATLAAIPFGDVRSKGYAFQIEMSYRALRMGARVQEIAIRFADRRIGESKMSGTIFMEALTSVWKLRLGI
jgi:dolichol-phosphate mannosyltransferase